MKIKMFKIITIKASILKWVQLIPIKVILKYFFFSYNNKYLFQTDNQNFENDDSSNYVNL